jgi:hypothetical protein
MMKTGKAHGEKIQRAPSVTTQSLIARAAGCCRRQRACVIFTQAQDISHNLCALAATPSQPRNAARAVRDQIASGLDYLELSI